MPFKLLRLNKTSFLGTVPTPNSKQAKCLDIWEGLALRWSEVSLRADALTAGQIWND